MEHQLALGAIDALTTIWLRVLQRPSAGIEDRFFDLGGDPASVARLFAEIADAFGRELPPETIYQAPTIADLAALLEKPETPQLPPLAGQRRPQRRRSPGICADGAGQVGRSSTGWRYSVSGGDRAGLAPHR